MKSYLYRCVQCNTTMTVETELEDDKIHRVPPCVCGKARMDLQSK